MADIIGICGSARKHGNTATLLREVLASSGLASELIFLSDLNIGFCSGCHSCIQNQGKCIKQDDMPGLLDKFLAARAIVLGTPNYYYDVSGLMKNMIDRSIAANYLGVGEYTGAAWHGWRPFVDTAGGFVICQAAFGADKAMETFNCLADYSGLQTTGTVIATLGNQPVTDFPEYIEAARELGRAISAAIIGSA
jgi:NAD(P)H-dependent FMN reductase